MQTENDVKIENSSSLVACFTVAPLMSHNSVPYMYVAGKTHMSWGSGGYSGHATTNKVHTTACLRPFSLRFIPPLPPPTFCSRAGDHRGEIFILALFYLPLCRAFWGTRKIYGASLRTTRKVLLQLNFCVLSEACSQFMKIECSAPAIL